MENILEQQRHYHEERERLLDALTKEQSVTFKTHREKLNSQHRCRYMVDRYLEITRDLKDLYEDKDGLRKEDIQALSGPNEFGVFYERVKQIKEFHRKHPDQISVPLSVEYQEFDRIRDTPEEAAAAIVTFSDEEAYGKYLDLHECHNAFLNLKSLMKLDYLSYLDNFDRLSDLPREKKNNAYKRYVNLLLDYLEDFYSRIHPMHDLLEDKKSMRARFDQLWTDGRIPGWHQDTPGSLSSSAANPGQSEAGGAHLDLSAFSRHEELMGQGLDRLKAALIALGLKCGGTLEERAKRLWATKGLSLDQIPKHLFLSSLTTTTTAAGESRKRQAGKKSAGILANPEMRELAWHEYRVAYLAEALKDVRSATRENVQRRQARTGEEREESDDDEDLDTYGGNAGNENGDPNEGDDDSEFIHNPKQLPLGWDNKPIPYWLYKLHGLNMYFTCEICGNATYRGPKMFLKHFSEMTHAYGMRRLEIPNTAHFANVTKIDEAIALWQKIRTSKSAQRWNPEQEEEFEDSVGNVVTKKTYEDLKRQDLL